MTGLFIFLGIFVVLIAWGIHIRNNIVRYFNATKRAWAEVANFERQKVKTLRSTRNHTQSIYSVREVNFRTSNCFTSANSKFECRSY